MKNFRYTTWKDRLSVFLQSGTPLFTLELPKDLHPDAAADVPPLSLREEGNTLLAEVHIAAPENNLELPLQLPPTLPVFCSTLTSPWWMTAAFPEEGEDRLKQISGRIQACFLKLDEASHALLLCLPGERFRCAIEQGSVKLVSGGNSPCLDGVFLSLTVASSPYQAAEEGFAALRRAGVLPVPRREERVYPEILKGFGFCSWNAFYQKVNAAGLFEKLEEFKAVGVPIDFLVIDDGWSLLRDGKLASFGADPEKFPGGLSAAIQKIKNDYGVRYVGVWHAIHGYWDGVDPESTLYQAEKENLVFDKDGICFPAPDEEKAFAFYDHFYTALSAEGVDFVKVDVQSVLPQLLDGIAAPSEGVRAIHRGLERAVAKHFGGNIINCMGMDFENCFARPFTAVNRNSDDFFVNDTKRGFVSHAMANAYNALTHGELYYTDFDMWWSVHPEGKRSAVLRALSGGPQYVSDRLHDAETGNGGSDQELILPLLDGEGKALFPFHAGRPTADCVYRDPRKEGILKVWNEGPLGYAVAAFHCGGEERQGTLRLSDIPGAESPLGYAVQEYFTGEITLLRAGESLEFSLPAGSEGVKLWNLYPLREDGSALLGDPAKYLGVCTAGCRLLHEKELS